jgi:hypothetical protein
MRGNGLFISDCFGWNFVSRYQLGTLLGNPLPRSIPRPYARGLGQNKILTLMTSVPAVESER